MKLHSQNATLTAPTPTKRFGRLGSPITSHPLPTSVEKSPAKCKRIPSNRNVLASTGIQTFSPQKVLRSFSRYKL